MKSLLRGCLFVFASSLFIDAAVAEPVLPLGRVDYAGIRVESAPKIDGMIEDGEWPAAARESGFTDKDTNLTSDEPAEFWLTYDSEYIYFAGRVQTDPNKIIDEEYRQNVGLRGNDNFGLLIDPFGNANNFNVFETNAAGATSIGLAGGRAAKTEWLGEIEANGRKTETGWECEMRIPWSIMTLPAAGIHNPRINVSWYRSNKNNSYNWKFTNGDSRLVPYWSQVEIPAVNREKSIKLLPFWTASAQEGKEFGFNSGLDFKTEFTDQIQFVGTVNPDFENIESAVLSLDFSRFERLGNENRPFFQEGERYFRTGFDQRLFAPQRIGRIDAGVKMYGNLNSSTQFGAMSTANFGDQIASVVSISSQLSDNRSIQAAYVRNDETGKEHNSGQFNYFDRYGKFGLFLNNQFTDDAERGSGWRNSWGFNFNEGGTRIGVDYQQVSADFFPRLGFSPERDYKGLGVFMMQEFTPSHGAFTSYNYRVSADSYDRLTGGFYKNGIGVGFEGVLKSGLGFELDANWSNFEGSADHVYSVELGYPAGNPYRALGVDYSTGEFAGISYQNIGFFARYKPLKRMQLSLRSQFVDYRDQERQHLLSLSYDLDKYQSIAGRLVEENGRSNWYLSYRMSGGKGNEYFLIIGDPRSDQFANRIAFKMTIPLEVRY